VEASAQWSRPVVFQVSYSCRYPPGYYEFLQTSWKSAHV
jgi:hypothetical protein